MTAAAPTLGRRVHVIQGQQEVSDDPDVILTTALGSCLAACIRDPIAAVGGMNHFLLPEGRGVAGQDAYRYGAYAMELLVNALMSRGARRERLEAKLFGGANLADRLIDIGALNVAFARRFLDHEGIRYAGGSVRGRHARRLQFWPVSGRIRQLSLVKGEDAIFAAEARRPGATPDWGQVELFD
jgi:chemotaxis protein CheD